jgi:hypothetical protein
MVWHSSPDPLEASMTRYHSAPIVREIFPPQPTPQAPPDAARRGSQRDLVLASLMARPGADAAEHDER